jgi:hypothetical protein
MKLSQIIRDTFKGRSWPVSGGIGPISVICIKAWQESEAHFPGAPENPPYSYSGTLVSGAGGLINFLL